MVVTWIVDVVARVTIDGELTKLYKGKEFVVLEENEYVKSAIARGWTKKTGDTMTIDDGVDWIKEGDKLS